MGGDARTDARTAAPPGFRKTGGGNITTTTTTTWSRMSTPSAAAASAVAPARAMAAAVVSRGMSAGGVASSRKRPAQAALVVASAASAAAAAAAAPRPKPVAASSSPTKPVSRYSGSAGWDLKARRSKAASAVASAAGPAGPPVARYSGSTSQQRRAAAAAAVAGKGKAPLSTHENPGQQIARYSVAARGGARGNNKSSGARGTGGRPIRGGRGALAWRGRGRTGAAWSGASINTHRGWPPGLRRGFPAWRGRWGTLGHHSFGGRGLGGLRSRYPAWVPPIGRFKTHPASRWAAGYCAHPWANRYAAYGGGRGRGRGRGSFPPAATGRSRQPPRGKQVRYKNRTLIRVRGLLPQRPLMARTAVLTGAVARRASCRAAGSLSSTSGTAAPPAKFVHGGKHGMSIRRVNSSDLAVRRAAAAAAATSSPPAKRLKTTNGRVGAVAGGGRPDTARGFQRAGGVKTTAAGAFPKATAFLSARSTAATARRAVLMAKAVARARSGATRRAAASVVADARAKSSRLRLVRNMTLYRGKGQAVVVGGGGGKTTPATEQQQPKKSKKKVQKTDEPCLFFCRFGKCSKSDEDCRFVHDKAKVAVCRAFLRKGGCDKGDECLLTHAVQAEKMPVCIYFEKGMCFTPNCPYLHVKVSQNAAICPSFLKVPFVVARPVFFSCVDFCWSRTCDGAPQGPVFFHFLRVEVGDGRCMFLFRRAGMK